MARPAHHPNPPGPAKAFLTRLRNLRSRDAAHDPSRLTMGAHSYGDPLVLAYEGDSARVSVGAYCSLGQDATFMVGGAHRVDWVTTFPLRARFGLPGAFEDGHPATRGDITVGSDVWIARDALVLSGVTIGHGAVVATRSVVTSDVRPYAVVAGNPAREIRRRFTDAQVESLLRVAWWDWPDARVLAAVDGLSSPDIDRFLRAHDPGHDGS